MIAQSVAIEADTVGPEGIGLENLRAGFAICAMHFANQLRSLEVDFVVGDVDENTAPVQLGAECPVEQVSAPVANQDSEVGHGFLARAGGRP